MKSFWHGVAQILPRKLVYYATIRLWAFGTVGIYGDTNVSSLTIYDALDRWDGKESKGGEER